MKKITDKLGLSGYTLYGFRHSMGTLASNPSKDKAYNGNLEVARQLLGHRSIAQTNTYNHPVPEFVRDEFEKLTNLRNIRFQKKG